MNPGAFDDRRSPFGAGSPSRVVWPSVVALLFAALSMISFAVDQSVTLSNLPEVPGFNENR